MRQASKRIPESAEKTVRDIRRATRRHHSAEEKIRIVLEGLRGEDSIAELCRKEGINPHSPDSVLNFGAAFAIQI
jgi:transposase